MIFRLVSEKNPQKKIQLTAWAWRQILEMGKQHGWNPYGTVAAEWLSGVALSSYMELDGDESQDGYLSDHPRLVLIEDALNLADALDRAFMSYEPVFVHHDAGWPGVLSAGLHDRRPPGIGVIQMVQALSSSGAFQILPAERLDKEMPSQFL